MARISRGLHSDRASAQVASYPPPTGVPMLPMSCPLAT